MYSQRVCRYGGDALSSPYWTLLIGDRKSHPYLKGPRPALAAGTRPRYAALVSDPRNPN